MTRFLGIGASSGSALGRALVFRHDLGTELSVSLGPEEEKAVFLRARSEVEEELRALAARTGRDEAGIFEGYAEILMDGEIADAVNALIDKGLSAAEAGRQALDDLAAEYRTLDAYMAERAGDIADLGKKLREAASGRKTKFPELSQPCILIADELSPFETARLDRPFLKALALDRGGYTGHVAILARSLGIPCAVGLGAASEQAKSGVFCALDGDTGLLLLEPAEEEAERFRAREARERQLRGGLLTGAKEAARSVDGCSIMVCANIGSVEEGGLALSQGADGTGLLRTEFLYMNGAGFPSEEAQFTAYSAIAEQFGSRPLTIRTLDLGGDKEFPALGLEKEENPFLGYRAIRICLNEEELFKTQLRAVLRASALGKTEIMFPMIISLDELRAARALLERCKQELRDEGRACGNPAVGIMIETPAAAVLAPELAGEADFFSIGTNDLTQYTLAVDRGNTRTAALYDALHPAVLRLIAGTCKAAAEKGIPVCLCGELAASEEALPLLIGFGMNKLSMSASKIPIIKENIRRLDSRVCQKAAQAVLSCKTQTDVRTLLASLKAF